MPVLMHQPITYHLSWRQCFALASPSISSTPVLAHWPLPNPLSRRQCLRTGPFHILYLDASAYALAHSISSILTPVLAHWPLQYYLSWRQCLRTGPFNILYLDASAPHWLQTTSYLNTLWIVKFFEGFEVFDGFEIQEWAKIPESCNFD